MPRRPSVLGGISLLVAIASAALGGVDRIDVDIKPGSYPNRVNPHARGVVPVAILGSGTFDVSDIDVTTLAFGSGGASSAHDLTGSFTYNDHLRDVNMDEQMDLVTHYRVRDTGIACGDTSAALSGVSTARIPCIDFMPSDPPPGPPSVTARNGPGADCDTAVIDLIVSEVDDLYGATFEITYPPALASFVQASDEGTVLGSDGAAVVLLAAEPQPGELLVAITRLGAVPGIDVADALLVRLSFEKTGSEGTALLEFTDAQLFDASFPPGVIPNIVWSGGVVTVDETTVSSPFEGSDSIQTVGCRPHGKP